MNKNRRYTGINLSDLYEDKRFFVLYLIKFYTPDLNIEEGMTSPYLVYGTFNEDRYEYFYTDELGFYGMSCELLEFEDFISLHFGLKFINYNIFRCFVDFLTHNDKVKSINVNDIQLYDFSQRKLITNNNEFTLYDDCSYQIEEAKDYLFKDIINENEDWI